MRRLCTIAAAVAVCFAGTNARAERTEAAKLFDDGVGLLDQGRVSEACPKLEASQRLEPAAGTLLNLAGCYERSGRRARALATFREASEAARSRGRNDWQKVADEHIAALAAALPKLTIHRGHTTGALSITVDGVALGDAELGVERSIDPGTHVVVARSPGNKPYSNAITIRESIAITIPLLEPLPVVEPPAKDDARRIRQIAGVATMVVGVVGVGIAGASAIVAGNALDEAKSKCTSYPTRCGPDANGPNDRADTWSTVSTVSAIFGGVLVAGGAALFFWPSPQRSTRVGFDGTRVLVGGRF